MHTLEQPSAKSSSQHAIQTRAVLALRIMAVLLPGALAAACEDGAPTAVRTAEASPVPAMDMAHSAEAGGFAVQVLSRTGFADDIAATFRIKLDGGTKVVHVTDPSDAIVAKITIQPGGSLGWHTHPGPVIATIASGELSIINASDCVTRHYGGGNAFVDPGQGNVHIGFNDTASETVVYATYLGVPAGQPATIPAQDPGC
jgi:hypothetical protein